MSNCSRINWLGEGSGKCRAVSSRLPVRPIPLPKPLIDQASSAEALASADIPWLGHSAQGRAAEPTPPLVFLCRLFRMNQPGRRRACAGLDVAGGIRVSIRKPAGRMDAFQVALSTEIAVDWN